MVKPLVSVIVANWNGQRFLRNCLVAVLGQEYENIEVIVSDNGSTDSSLELLKEFPGVKLIENGINIGFAEANNVAIRSSRGEYIATLNPDTEPDSEWVASLVSAATQKQSAGSLASKVLFMEEPNRIGSAGEMILPTGDVMGRGFYWRDAGQYEVEEEVFGTTAGAGFYRRRALQNVGLFDSNLFTWYEDVDLSWRLRKAGWKSYYIPKAVVRHYQSGSMDERNQTKLFYLHRNKLYVVLKNYPLALLARYAAEILWSEFTYLLIAGDRRELGGLCGQVAALSKFPRAIVERVRGPPSVVSVEDLASWIEKGRSDFHRLGGAHRFREYLRDIERRPRPEGPAVK